MAKCPIWGTPCKDSGSTDEFYSMDSPRAGGKYKLLGSAQRQVMELTTGQKRAVTSWIISQHVAGNSIPTLSAHNIDEIKHRRPLNFNERVDRALSFLAARTRIGGTVAVDVVSSQSREALDEFLALTESEDAGEAQSMLKMLGDDMALVGRSQDTLFFLKPKGWARVDEVRRREVQSSQAFIAMWFDLSTDEPFRNGLYRAIYDSGYDPVRVDQQHHHLNKVDDEIVAEIRRSKFLVADFTCAPGHVRGGVYFEAGFAMGLNIPIGLHPVPKTPS